MTELTKSENQELSFHQDVAKNQFYFSVNKLINQVGTQKYKTIKPLLETILSEEQVTQLRKEKHQLQSMIRKKIRNNPYELQSLEELYGDHTDYLINGIMSQGEDFVTRFLNNDKEIHQSITMRLSDECQSYCIPYNSSQNKTNDRIKNIDKMVNEANDFLKEFENINIFSEEYKNNMKDSVNYLIETVQKVKDNTLEENFDINGLKEHLNVLSKMEGYCYPIYSKLNINNGLSHAGWSNLTGDYLRENKVKEFIEQYDVNDLFSQFNSTYIDTFENEDIKLLKELSEQFDSSFEKFNKAIDVDIQKTNKINKPKRNKP